MWGKFYEKCMQEDNKYQTFAVANYILDKLRRHGINDITNVKLQKVLYLAYGLYLCLTNEELFQSPIYAWKLGPVVPDIYSEFKDFGRSVITTKAAILLDDDSGEVVFPELPRNFKTKPLDIACTGYGQKRAWDLVDITHDKASAWGKHYIEGKMNIILPKEDIRAELEDKLGDIAKYLSK